MWPYLILLIVVFILLLIGLIYLVRVVHNILKNHINNKLLCWITSLLPIILLAIGLYIDMVNTIVVYIHVIVFIILIKLLLFILRKKVSEGIILICGVILTTVYLSYGYYLAYHVVETDYMIYTEKNIDDFRIVQISDSHIGTTFNGEELYNYVKDINELNPDIVVITGDFIDDNTRDDDIVSASKSLGKLKAKYGVYFAFGNHDRGYFSSKYGLLCDNLHDNNVIILEDASIDINNNIILIGRRDARDSERVEAREFMKSLDLNKYIIMLDHQPTDYENEAEAGVDLVLSGHTHGGQLIPLGQIGLLLGANDMIYGMKTINNTTFIVNSGISDWALKFKTGTKSEYVVIDVKNK